MPLFELRWCEQANLRAGAFSTPAKDAEKNGWSLRCSRKERKAAEERERIRKKGLVHPSVLPYPSFGESKAGREYVREKERKKALFPRLRGQVSRTWAEVFFATNSVFNQKKNSLFIELCFFFASLTLKVLIKEVHYKINSKRGRNRRKKKENY